MRASDWEKIIAHSGFGIIIFGISSITAWETEDIRVVRIGETFLLELTNLPLMM